MTRDFATIDKEQKKSDILHDRSHFYCRLFHLDSMP